MMGSKRARFAVVCAVAISLAGCAAQDVGSGPVEHTPTLPAATETPALTGTPEPSRTPRHTPTKPATRTPMPQGPGVIVTRVIDGDTIEVEGGERVRYIGIDTPESTTRHECYGEEASRRNAELVGRRVVMLERDISDRDQYGRLLRYVWLDGVMINEQLVLEGYATVSTYPPDVRYEERFLAAQAEARRRGVGLWGGCPTPTGCAPAYPDVCIPPPPPDLGCRDITPRFFRVLPPDPHEFDGNRDGVGCEIDG